MGSAGEGGDHAGATAGAAGASAECTTPNPAGCALGGCPDDQTCMLTSGRCIPSSCECVDGGWACTKDCGGGVCGEGSACEGENPAGCRNDDECSNGERCLPPEDEVCIPLGCACGLDGRWSCLEECGGGECRASDCPAGCRAGTEPFCNGDGVTWVCGFDGPWDATELIDAGCRDLGTQIPRFCCAASFKPECAL